MAEWLIFEDIVTAKKVVSEGETTLIKIGNTEVCLIRRNNTFHAVNNECPHLGSALNRGSINFQNEIVCPWHSYRFNFLTGEEVDRRCSDLKIYQLSEKEGGLYLEL